MAQIGELLEVVHVTLDDGDRVPRNQPGWSRYQEERSAQEKCDRPSPSRTYTTSRLVP